MASFCAGSIGTRLGNCPTDAVKGTVLIRKFTHYGYSSSDICYDYQKGNCTRRDCRFAPCNGQEVVHVDTGDRGAGPHQRRGAALSKLLPRAADSPRGSPSAGGARAEVEVACPRHP